MCFPQLYATVGIGGAGHKVQLDVRCIDRMISVFGVDESQSLDATHDRQRTVTHSGVVQNCWHIFDSFLYERHLNNYEQFNEMTNFIFSIDARKVAVRLY